MATISLDHLAERANPKRQAIATALKALHKAANVSGDPHILDAANALHAALGDADKEIIAIVNDDGTPRARPMDGGDGGNKNPN